MASDSAKGSGGAKARLQAAKQRRRARYSSHGNSCSLMRACLRAFACLNSVAHLCQPPCLPRDFCSSAASAKQALAAVDGKGGKKESVVKGFVASLSKTEGGRAGERYCGRRGGGDWHCPNCKIVVFASKTQCFLCRTRR